MSRSYAPRGHKHVPQEKQPEVNSSSVGLMPPQMDFSPIQAKGNGETQGQNKDKDQVGGGLQSATVGALGASKVSEEGIFCIKDANATIRNDKFATTKAKIGRGTMVHDVDTSADKKYGKVRYVDDPTKEYWTTKTNYVSVTRSDSSKKNFVAFDDTFVYEKPFDKKAKTKTVGKVTSKEKIASKTEVRKVYEVENFVKIQSAGGTDLGWVNKFNLQSEGTKLDSDYLMEYKTWLLERYTEVAALEGQAKLEAIQNHLLQIERACLRINGGETPPLNLMEKYNGSADYSSLFAWESLMAKVEKEQNKIQLAGSSMGAFAPPQLIGTIRKFIVLSERSISKGGSVLLADNDVDQSPDKQVGGSLYSANDWNSRLGVPQYRTQSDNLASPEATCSPTAFAMITERLGSNRNTIIDAINEKLTGGHNTMAYLKQTYLATPEGAKAEEVAKKNKTEIKIPDAFAKKTVVPANFKSATAYGDAKIKVLWDAKLKKYLASSHMNGATDNYRKTRGNKGALKSADIISNFKDTAQLEDLIDFYHYVKDYGARTRLNVTSNQKMYNRVTNPNFDDKNDSVKKVEKLEKWNPETRSKLVQTVNEGGGAALSIFHKGASSTGTHIVSVQSVNATEIVVDDPYGKINQDYRRTSGKTNDMYLPAGKNSPRERSKYDYKNKPNFEPKEKDYKKRDFTASAAQNLESNESGGDSWKIPFTMLNESGKSVMNYLLLYPRF